MSKKRKISGMGELELDLAIRELRKLRSVAVEEVSDELDDMITTLESQVNGPLVRSNIVLKGVIYLHPKAALRDAIIASRAVGSDKLWSNDTMYKHLALLANSFTAQKETSRRTALDTFFFRATAMVPSHQQLIVMQVPAGLSKMDSEKDTVSEIVHHAAFVAESTIAENYIHRRPRFAGPDDSIMVFFVAEAKGSSDEFGDYLPHVLELVVRAKHLGKSHIRGALTNGFKWVFLVVDLDADGDGVKYWVSEEIEWRWTTKQTPTSDRTRVVEGTDDEYDPALIAGILSSWIPHSYAEFKDDEWFIRRPEDT